MHHVVHFVSLFLSLWLVKIETSTFVDGCHIKRHGQHHVIFKFRRLFEWVKLQTHTHARARARIHTQPFYGSLDFVQDIPESRYPKKTFTTHNYFGHQSSLMCFLHLLRSMASSLFNLCAWQSFHNLSSSFLWCTSWPGTLHFILHTFLHLIIVFFSQHISVLSLPVLL